MLKNRFKKRAIDRLQIGLLTVLALLSNAIVTSAQDFGFPSLPSQPPVQSGGQSPVQPATGVQPAVQPTSAAICFETVVSSSEIVGATFVALDNRLRQVFRGSEPKSLNELKALEEQQEKVAKAIEQVTVNVQQGSAQGSGVIITGDGYILTAAHVAGKPGRQAWVRLSDGTRVEATTLGMNRDKDAGLIKINSTRGTPWPHATIGRSQDLRVGQWCIAAGHPGGWQEERGNVIRVGRILTIKGDSKGKGEWSAHTLFTDCTLIGGDSGGPLFTLEAS